MVAPAPVQALHLVPTEQVVEVCHPYDQTTVSCRVWLGVDGRGARVTALIAAIRPDMGEGQEPISNLRRLIEYRDQVRRDATGNCALPTKLIIDVEV